MSTPPAVDEEELSMGKKHGSNLSLSAISKSFSKKTSVSQFATSVRRKFSQQKHQSQNTMKNVLGRFFSISIITFGEGTHYACPI